MIARRFFLVLALVLVAPHAVAQLHKCIDERGRTQYTDKPVPGCKPVGDPQRSAAPAQPRAAPSQGAASIPAKPGAAAKKAAPPHAELAKKKPAVPAPKPASKPKPPAANVQAAPQQTKAQVAARCKGLQEEHDWLMSPRGEGIEARTARISQVKQAMRGCP